MAGKTVWIRNNRNSSIKVRGIHNGEPVEVLIERESVNRLTRAIETRGYNPIDIEVHEALMATSKIYKSMIDKGDLVMLEEAPEEAFTDAQRVVRLETKVTGLETTIANLEKENTALKEEIAALKSAAEKSAKSEKPAKPTKSAKSGEATAADAAETDKE